MKTVSNRKELRALLKKAKFFTFDQDGSCATYYYGESLCKVIQLDERVQERVHDKLGKYFKGPQYLYLFESITKSKKFINVNLIRYKDQIKQPHSYEIADTILTLLARTDLILQYDAQLLKLYRDYSQFALLELKRWRTLNECLKDINLVINNFINK